MQSVNLPDVRWRLLFRREWEPIASVMMVSEGAGFRILSIRHAEVERVIQLQLTLQI
jgi:hypothetical protein